MNWLHIGDLVKSKRCNERRRYGVCGCKTRKGVNPCRRHEEIATLCELLEGGDVSANAIEAVYKHVNRYRCVGSRSGSCQHLACIQAEQKLDWIAQALRKVV